MGPSCLARADGLAQGRSAGKISCLPSLEEREIQKVIFCTDSVSPKLGNFAMGASRRRSSPASAFRASPNAWCGSGAGSPVLSSWSRNTCRFDEAPLAGDIGGDEFL